jgi:hypothetical protein
MPAEGEVVNELPSGAQPRRMMGAAAADLVVALAVRRRETKSGEVGGWRDAGGDGSPRPAGRRPPRWKDGRAVCSFVGQFFNINLF